MLTLTTDERASCQKVLQEFNSLTNEEAYVHIFSHRLMKPVPSRTSEFFGTDQRLYMMPYLKKLVAELMHTGSQVFDVGAGAGDVVDYALRDAPKGTVVNIEEPNHGLLDAYRKKLKEYPHLQIGVVYDGPLQDYYEGKKRGAYPKELQNLVLAIHMIYHLTQFEQEIIDPEKDLIEAMSFLYGRLTPGGSIFIVYADLLDSPNGEAVCGMAEKYFRHRYPEARFADNLVTIYKARNDMLGPQGQICKFLKQRYPDTNPILHSERKESHFFGETVADIAVLGLATELCPSDRNKFDLTKLEFCLDYVTKHPDRIGLQKEEGNVPQKGMWRAKEPEVIAVITKQS